MARVVYVVSHTHWDREWYRTYAEFRVRLHRVVRQVLDALETDEAFRHFVLDGQAILLEDHLAVHPEDDGRIRALVEHGALSLGPWYVLPDEFLVSGESTVRNLLVGHEVASAFGEPQRVGYMPDSFGHIAQLPQILRQAGLDSFVYTRGNGDEIDRLGHEYLWRAPDGSEVLAVNQCEGYCNAGGLGFHEIWHAHTRREVDLDRAVEQVRELLEKMAPGSRSDLRLLNNGCDHFPPQRDLGRVLQRLREAFPGTEFRHTDLERFVADLRAAGVAFERYEGELLGGRLHPILSGVWSARMPLKQKNDSCQTLLADVVEPLCAYTHFLQQSEYPAGAIKQNWKTLMQNHPHDSICGCSIDEVHREMGPRFDTVLQGGEQLVRDELERLAPTFASRAELDGRTVLCVANPLPEPRTVVLERLVVLAPPVPPAEELRLLDGRGRPVPFEVIDSRLVERFWGVDYRTELDAERQREKFGVYADRFGARILRPEAERSRSDGYLTIRFAAELPALGHASFELVHDPRAATPTPVGDVVLEDGTLENAHLRLRLHADGSFDVEHKATGECYRGLNRLEDREDIGDEYDYSPAAESLCVTSAGVRGDLRVLEAGGLRGGLEARLRLPLPSGIDPERRRRLAEIVECPLTVRVRLDDDSPVVDVELVFDNRARDHRLRARFPSGLRTETIVCDGAFLVQRRPCERQGSENWVQPAPRTWPQQEFSLLEDGRRGLAVLNRGLPEIEAMREPDGSATLALTLLRSVDWLSRDDFDTRRRRNAGPTLYTPDAQCLGEHRFRYAVVPFVGGWLDGDVKGASRRWRVGPVAVQGVADGSRAGESLFGKEGTKTCVSAVKKHESRDTLIVRLFNLTSEPVDETLTFGRDVRSAFVTDLLERRERELSIDDCRRLTLRLAPHRIVTVELDWKA